MAAADQAHSVRSTKAYYSLPYNQKLKEYARELRKAGNLAEVLLWQQLKNKQLRGLDFDRQKIIGNYIVDFFCASCHMVIEIDGCTHNDKAEYDAEREAYLQSIGLTVIHLDDHDIKKELNGVMDMLYAHPALIGGDHPVPPAAVHPPA
jgi:very-short-patch-repair endonuclease